MLIQMTNKGNSITFTNSNIEEFSNVENVIVVAKGIKDILQNSTIRKYLIDNFGKDDVIYLVCPDTVDKIKNQVLFSTIDYSLDSNNENILNAIGMEDDTIPMVIDRRKLNE